MMQRTLSGKKQQQQKQQQPQNKTLFSRTCTYEGVRNVRFSENLWHALFSCYLCFEICLFALLPKKSSGKSFLKTGACQICLNFTIKIVSRKPDQRHPAFSTASSEQIHTHLIRF